MRLAPRCPRAVGSTVALALLAATLGCREDAATPTGPAPEAATTAAAPLTLRQVTASRNFGDDHHTCGVATDDRAYCWGSNSWGQLGLGGDFGGPHDCFGDPCSRLPAPVAGNLRWKHLRAG